MIASINYSLLSSNEFYTFNLRVLELFAGKNLEATGIEVFVEKLRDVSVPFGKAFERESRDPYTQMLIQADAGRDECHFAFRNYVEACSHRNKPGWHDAAIKIMEVIRKHGWSAAHFGYKAETAAITSTISELRSKYEAELTLIAATDWLNELDEAQQIFANIAKDSVAPKEDEPTIAGTRPSVTRALRSLFGMITLQYEAAGSIALADYAKSINDLIVQSMTSAKANATRVENKKNENAQPSAQVK